MNKWLIVSPIFDSVTQDTYDESREALKYIEGKFEITADLSGKPIARKDVEEALKEPGINLAFWDHGSDDALWGSSIEAVIDLNNSYLLKGKEIFASACSYGKKGAVEAWKQGAAAVLCYSEIVVYTTDAKEEFCEAFNYPLYRRADGYDWLKCLELTKEKMNELIAELVAAGKVMAASALGWDCDHLECYTPDNPPTSNCKFRRAAIKIFGPKKGWAIPRSLGIRWLIWLLAMTITSILSGHPSLTMEPKETVATIILCVYIYFLWQDDHMVAPLVWEHKGDMINGWIFGAIERTNYYNICMLFKMFCPPTIFFVLTLIN